jgi:hypothetical protein
MEDMVSGESGPVRVRDCGKSGGRDFRNSRRRTSPREKDLTRGVYFKSSAAEERVFCKRTDFESRASLQNSGNAGRGPEELQHDETGQLSQQDVAGTQSKHPICQKMM